MDKIIFTDFLNEDMYITFKGIYDGKPAIIKFFGNMSDENNEFEILEYLQKTKHKNLFPIPYLKLGFDSIILSIVLENGKAHILEDIYKMIVYEYIEGITLKKPINSESIIQIRNDISEHLSIIHEMGFVHGDVHTQNIIYTPHNKKYILIDYGQTFSKNDKQFPPMQFMIDDIGIPTKKDDFHRLNQILR